MLRLITLLPVSLGFAHVVVLCSAGILNQLGPQRVLNMTKRIAATMGGLSDSNRINFVLGGMEGVLVALFLGLVLLLIWRLLLPWFDEMAMSLITAVPLLKVLDIVWLPVFRVEFHSIVAVSIYLIVPLFIAIMLFSFYLFLTSRRRSEANETSVENKRGKQYFWRFFVAVIYLSTCAYGWSDLRRSRTELIEEFELWEDQMEAWENRKP